MLVLSRRIGESIVIGKEVIVRVARVSGTRAFLAIEAPTDIPVDRQEIWLVKNREPGETDTCDTGQMWAGTGGMKQDEADCEVWSKEACMNSCLVGRAIPKLNQVLGAGMNEKDRVNRDNRHSVRENGVPLDGQTDAIGLRAALHCLIADHRACNGPEIEFCDDLVVDELQPEFQRAVLAIVRELLLNARCHSKSKNVLLGLAQDGGNLFVQVQDWGIGFDPESAEPYKRGLKGIRDMVGWLGGTVAIYTQRGAGTSVIVEVPFLQESGRSYPTWEGRPR